MDINPITIITFHKKIIETFVKKLWNYFLKLIYSNLKLTSSVSQTLFLVKYTMCRLYLLGQYFLGYGAFKEPTAHKINRFI